MGVLLLMVEEISTALSGGCGEGLMEKVMLMDVFVSVSSFVGGVMIEGGREEE